MTQIAAAPDLYFCPNGSVAETVRRRDLQEEKRRCIQRLHVLDQRWNLVVPLHFGIWLGAGYVAVQSTGTMLNLAMYIMGGLSLSTLSVLAHESVHNLFTRKHSIDRWIGFLCGLPVIFSAGAYRVMHHEHHKHVRSPNDPDDIENVTRSSRLLALVYVTILLVGVYAYIVQVPAQAIKNSRGMERVGVVAECVGIVFAVALAWTLVPAAVMVEAWLIPLLVAGMIANMRGIAEHGMTTGGNEFSDTRTVMTNPVLSFMMCNINYHLEHHLYPGVPWYNLPKVHALLQDEYRAAGSSVYSSYTSFLADILRALRTGVVPGRRLIPRHLREGVCL